MIFLINYGSKINYGEKFLLLVDKVYFVYSLKSGLSIQHETYKDI